MNNEEIRKKLIELSDDKYKEFHSGLCPGMDTEMLGVSIPKVRKLAKEIIKDNPEEYLKQPAEEYYEELLLQALVIANLKIELEKKKEYIINFVPKINCWAVCDSFCAGLKDADKNPEFFWKIISKYFKSKKEYEIRFAVVMLLDHYVKEEYINEIFEVIDNIKNDEYYVEMGIAWLVAEMYIKFPKQTMKYLKNCNLNKFTYNKALQKARESYRVSKEEKEILNKMKKK